jgi:hypothetical protein
MIDAAMRTFLESGCALLVGTADPDGRPHGGRAWGLEVLSDQPLTVRLLVDGRDEVTLANLAAGGAVAVTATSVRTLVSTQLKGHSEGLEVATELDAERVDRYCAAFFGDIEETDGTPRSTVERLRPATFATATIVVAQLFDQTPGPAAGAPVASTT